MTDTNNDNEKDKIYPAKPRGLGRPVQPRPTGTFTVMRDPRNKGDRTKINMSLNANQSSSPPAGRLLSSEVPRAGDSVHHRPYCPDQSSRATRPISGFQVESRQIPNQRSYKSLLP